MNVLIFSHKDDFDGMGAVVLARLAFKNVNCELTDCDELPELLEDYLEDNSILNYDKIFVTSMWLSDPMLSKVAGRNDLKDKFYVFDTHRSAIEKTYDRYPFTYIRVSDDLGKCSGTSLFYDFLIKNGFLEKKAKGIYKFSELTRKYDTWEWKTRYKDDEPEDLFMFYKSVGNKIYIDLMFEKLKNNDFHFALDEEDQKKVEAKRKDTEEKVNKAIKTIRYKNLSGYKVAVMNIDYSVRNDITEKLKDEENEADFIMMISEGRDFVSFRSLNPDVNVRLIVEEFGGTGHDFAAKAPIDNEQIKKLIED